MLSKNGRLVSGISFVHGLEPSELPAFKYVNTFARVGPEGFGQQRRVPRSPLVASSAPLGPITSLFATFRGQPFTFLEPFLEEQREAYS
jgi:hypothetical protein